MRLMTLAMLLAATCAAAAPEEKHLTLPRSGPVRVAVVVSDGTTLIDIAGPMQVFDQIQAPPGSTEFQTFTVSETRQPIKAERLSSHQMDHCRDAGSNDRSVTARYVPEGASNTLSSKLPEPAIRSCVSVVPSNSSHSWLLASHCFNR
jgi:hypothetical protein